MALTQAEMSMAARRAGLSPSVGMRNYGKPGPLYGAQYALPDPATQTPVGGMQPAVIQGVKTTLDESQAIQQEIADNTKSVAVAIQTLATQGPGISVPGAIAGGTQMFAPTTAAYQDPVVQATVRQATRQAQTEHVVEKETTAADRRQRQKFVEAGPSRRDEEIPSIEDMWAKQGRDTGEVSPWATGMSNLRQPGGLKQRIAQSMQRRVQNLDVGPDLIQGGKSGRYYRRNADVYEDEAGRVRRATGKQRGQFASQAEIEQATAPAEEITSFKRFQTVQRGTQEFLGAIGEGATVGEATQGALGSVGLTGAAAAVAAPVAIYAAANQAKNFMNAQRQQNQQWQSILGGTNEEGYGERAREAVFANTQDWFGPGMGAGAARQLYEGSAQIYGRDRQARGTAQDFGVQMYRQLGMDVSQSLEVVRIAAQAGNDSLTDLAQSLTNVSTAARDAGVNANTARQNFEQQYQSATKMVTGPGVAATQGVLATAQTTLGRTFEGAQLTGLNQDQAMRQMAAQSGLSMPSFAARVGRDQNFAAGAYQGYVDQHVKGMLYKNPQVEGIINQATGGGTRKLSEAEYQDLAAKVMDVGQIDPKVAQQMLEQYVGPGFTEANAVEFLVRSQTDKSFRFEDIVKKQQGETRNIPLSEQDRRQMGGGTDQRTGQMLTPSMTTGSTKEMYQMITGGTRTEEGNVVGGDMQVTNDSQRDYLAMANRTGQRNPVLEKLLATEGMGGSTRFKVKTGEGDRYVTEDQLIRDYAGQAATATIAKGPNQGRTVAAALNMNLDPGVESDSRADAQRQTKAKSGDKDAPSGSSDDPNANKGLGGTIKVDASPQLSRYLTFLDSSGNPIDTSRSTGGVSPQQPPYGNTKTGGPPSG